MDERPRAFRPGSTGEVPDMALPDEAQVRQLAALAAPGGDDPWARARAADAAGLLGDLGPCFRRDRPDGVVQRRLPDLGEAIERFEAVARALGFEPPAAAADAAAPVLTLRDCRIDRCDLSSADVSWALCLHHCTVTATAEFVGTCFAQPGRFVGCVFRGGANFFAASFAGEAFFGGCQFGPVADFRGASFGGAVDFFQANYRESLELRGAVFEPPATLNVHELRFRGATALGGSFQLQFGQLRSGTWPAYRGRIAGEGGPGRTDRACACEQYGELEANFAAQGSPDAAACRDWCHYRYMDLRRQVAYRRANPLRWLDWLFMKWCFGYGIFTKRIVFTGLLAIVLFAGLYFTNGLGLGPEAWAVVDAQGQGLSAGGPWHVRLGNSLYYSAVTFATVGYGDYRPVHWAKLAGAVEGLLGVFIMAVFTVSFARKILR